MMAFHAASPLQRHDVNSGIAVNRSLQPEIERVRNWRGRTRNCATRAAFGDSTGRMMIQVIWSCMVQP